MTDLAHDSGLEVLLEAHTSAEYRIALNSGADVVGINNRDLQTLKVSLDTSRDLLREGKGSKIVVSESGLSKRSELEELRALGADAFLVGSSLMRSKDIEGSVRDLAGV
jgi:indole-3-glycerol phosphate synthase